ncbi:Rieske (2Fe-2S) protein [Streptomyces sp. LHD-70]|uniref:Rieske (2Fe-2S) protein n=1 Tax=Streptomyces sp. LHD-70 TaxID=3072140 RepID=UPI00280C76CB|nr:Rieske (2Fe-2S) protein [Streptomyces sp. LHD-70]MDQ8706540.1 Rieske (2Fe-2S) protein [Streptomyces sp. LHD-70]
MAASQDTPRPDPARRTVVAAVGVAGLAAAVTACGGSDDSGSEGGTGGTDTGTPTEGAPDSPTGGATEETGGGGAPLAKTSDIPEGGGKIFKEQKVVVTQPAAGEFKAFSATCTHQGCVVGSVSGGTINCPCHGSKFAVADGAVENGPATRPLPSEKIEVSGEEIRLL